MATQFIRQAGATLTGVVLGAPIFGPIGSAVGGVVGAAVDWYRAKHTNRAKHTIKTASPPTYVLDATGRADVSAQGRLAAQGVTWTSTQAADTHAGVLAGTVPSAVTAVGVSTNPPPTADTQAATFVVHLLLLGQPAERTSAAGWLKKFQASMNLPPTGVLDPTTRAALVKTVPSAANLPATTLLSQ